MASKIFIVVPGFGQQVTAATFMTVTALQGTLAAKSIGASVTTFSFPDIAELRSMFLSIWYDVMPDFDYLLFIDSDMAFPPDLVTDMILFNEPLVGTIYRQRNENISWAGSGSGEANAERRGNFMRVEGVGMGCTLIRRDVVTAILQRFPDVIDTRLKLHPAGAMLRNAGVTRLLRAFEKIDIPDRGIVSEDLSFCIRAKECGISTWAAISYKISHVGPYDYQGCYLEYVSQQAAEAEKQAQQKQLPAPQVQDIAAFPDVVALTEKPKKSKVKRVPHRAGNGAQRIGA